MAAIDPQPNAYTQLPYESNPFFESHPRRLETIAYLLGLSPPPIEDCRVLELGCAAGGNLLPAAEALPNATFLGIDLAPNQIAEGQKLISALHMNNIRLEAMSLTDLPAAVGPFDYIIAHGLYSWVPPDVQRRILEICNAHLAPDGVAYISYNTHPGWRLRGVLRDLIFFGLEDFTPQSTPRQKLAAGRAFADSILDAASDEQSTYHQLLQNEVEMVLKAPPSYIAHEYMETWHEPLYFREFAARAAEHGLAYLSDARFDPAIHRIESRLRLQQPDLGSDPIRFQQCLDFAAGRQFRRSLLTHAAQAIPTQMNAHRLMDCHLTAVPTSGEGDAKSENATLDSAVAALTTAFPAAISFHALCDVVQDQRGQSLDRTARHELAASLLDLIHSNRIEPHRTPPQFAAHVGPRPVASPLARLQASHGQTIHSRRHRAVRSFDEIDLSLLPSLDGTRDRAALLAALKARGKTIDEHALQQSLQHLAMNAVLIS